MGAEGCQEHVARAWLDRRNYLYSYRVKLSEVERQTFRELVEEYGFPIHGLESDGAE